MKAGTENRTKTIAAGVLGTIAVIAVLYTLYSQFGGSSAPIAPRPQGPLAQGISTTNNAIAGTDSRTTTNAGNGQEKVATMPTGNAAGVPAKKMATSSASLDPTLDQSAMLRTEHLVYAGSGRNVFSASYVPAVVIPKVIAPVRKNLPPPQQVYTPPPGPPPPPPINLKFFGTATRANGTRQAFLLQGDDVFLASQGDIVARKYRIVSISAGSIQVEDMANSNTQTLPLQSN